MNHFVKLLIVSLGFLSFGTITSNAQEQVLATYGAELGPEDYFNSSGTRLTSINAIIAQDRANFHRFGIRHEFDRTDPIFGDKAARARISQVPVTICCDLEQHVTKGLDRGYRPFLAVTVFGQGGEVTRLHLEVPG